MKNLTILLVLIILLLGAGNYIQWRAAQAENQNRISDNRKAQQKHVRDLKELGQRDSVILGLLNERSKDSTTHAKSQGALKAKIEALKRNVFTIVNVGHHYDSVVNGVYWEGGKIVRDDNRDRIIDLQDSLITDLENERDTLYITDNQAIDSLQASVTQLKSMYSEQYKRANRFQSDYDREKRKRWSLGPHAGYGFKGPDFGISIQYSLWRF
jgi:hypothetical protein